ncbi:transglycosylase SLT domain-containing protein [Asticcacaulis sp. EMRT-3]|nr:transglycosylase SLT domain-containing protein [Asticcacaulis sp. EMRT-3]MDI7774940.1 transglycosylase SLT domain-containing protein [Asticcacaulis sp. EMRT-3]
MQGAQNLVGTVGTGVMGAIQRAAAATGVDFGYLVKTAQRESSLNPNARAPTSSAAGLFQFIEQTWLGMVKANGARHGYGSYADQIVKGRDGRFHVSDPAARKQVLALRFNPDANAVMAAEMTAGHAAYLRGRIGRDPTQGELYAAHFLGPDGAADLIQAAATRPQATAASLFPQAARANHNIFYSHGRALAVSEVMANLTRVGGNQPVQTTPQAPEIDSSPVTLARVNQLRNDQAVLSLIFGDGDQKGLLFATQLMSGFGPGGSGEDGDQPDDSASSLMSGLPGLGGGGGVLG